MFVLFLETLTHILQVSHTFQCSAVPNYIQQTPAAHVTTVESELSYY